MEMGILNIMLMLKTVAIFLNVFMGSVNRWTFAVLVETMPIPGELVSL